MTEAERARLKREIEKMGMMRGYAIPRIGAQRPVESLRASREKRANEALGRALAARSETERASLLELARGIKQQHGEVAAKRWLQTELERDIRKSISTEAACPIQEVAEGDKLCPAYVRAVKLLEADREALGVAYGSVLVAAWLSLAYASSSDPAPHLQTTLWTLSEMTGKSARTLQRHLLESHHSWSSTVARWLDIRPVFGRYLEGLDRETGELKRKKRYVGVVFRFFPRTRQSERARVGKFGRRDLIAASDAGRTEFSRPKWVQEETEKARYGRGSGLMSLHSSPRLQVARYNWYVQDLSLPNRDAEENPVNVCHDIPKRRVLDELLIEREAMLEAASERGTSLDRARSLWVDRAARYLVQTWSDIGFTNLWRKVLWVATKTEMYGGTRAGWTLIQRMIDLIDEASAIPGLKKPAAYAYTQVKEAMEALARDYGAERAGVILA